MRPTAWWRRLALLVPLFLTIPLTCCATRTIVTTISPKAAIKKTVCESFAVIRYSGTGDSPETVIQIRQHNAALRSYRCEAK